MQILIVGAGDIGLQLAKRLAIENFDIAMIETDPRKVKRAKEQIDALVIEGHGSNYSALKTAGIDDADIVAAMTNNDEVNILVCQMAKKAGVADTLARVRNPEYTSPDHYLTLEELGIDVLIHPEKETADAVVRLIRQSSATDIIEFVDGRVELLGIRLEEDSKLLGIPLLELGPKQGDPPMRIVAIVRRQATIIPKGHDTLEPG
ncbi:MAG: NAD-binding protein, partial [Candidatus Krumholzibacteria bacterium]|nr:NAD-binding protein [Candidatus Krumholzibacteria bacterium]